MTPSRPKLLLASRSPRRRELLREHGVEHEAAHPGVDDTFMQPGSVSPSQWVAALAYLKAVAGTETLGERARSEEWIILGADTTCVVDDTIYGTPHDENEARAMLRAMSGREHEVLTGVALVSSRSGERRIFVDRATVSLGGLTEAQIDEYVKSGEWKGKAGAYNLAERLAAGWPTKYDGDPTGIMGLPMRALLPCLRGLGVLA
jgi:septum formation protein